MISNHIIQNARVYPQSTISGIFYRYFSIFMENIMTKDLMNACAQLDAGNYTCVICKEDRLFTATERGVAPLLHWVDIGADLRGFSAADRVVGRGAAFLYCLLGVQAVYAHVMSRPAAQVLLAHSIAVFSGTMVDGIINRKGTGPCPFEAAVMDIHNPQDALAAIRAKMALR